MNDLIAILEKSILKGTGRVDRYADKVSVLESTVKLFQTKYHMTLDTESPTSSFSAVQKKDDADGDDKEDGVKRCGFGCNLDLESNFTSFPSCSGIESKDLGIGAAAAAASFVCNSR